MCFEQKRETLMMTGITAVSRRCGHLKTVPRNKHVRYCENRERAAVWSKCSPRVFLTFCVTFTSITPRNGRDRLRFFLRQCYFSLKRTEHNGFCKLKSRKAGPDCECARRGKSRGSVMSTPMLPSNEVGKKMRVKSAVATHTAREPKH